MDKKLEIILKERYLNNRNLLSLETEDQCISTDYFGFGSLENLYKAHINNYKCCEAGFERRKTNETRDYCGKN